MKFDDRSVEVDGVLFETFLPDPVLVIPSDESDSTSTEFGFQITNLSSHPYHFTFFGLIPEIKGLNGQRLKSEYARNATRFVSRNDFLLAEPGATLSSVVAAKLKWSEGQLGLIGLDSSGGYWKVWGFQQGAYQVRFTYKGYSGEQLAILRPPVMLEHLWTGVISTPVVPFDIAVNLPKKLRRQGKIK